MFGGVLAGTPIVYTQYVLRVDTYKAHQILPKAE